MSASIFTIIHIRINYNILLFVDAEWAFLMCYLRNFGMYASSCDL